ncbi:MAG: AMP-dependent synthetase, partial [Hyphomicrobiales bacterium]|nr:AMP-dependent synthetase [Hyphomicrobiales bacterium]
MLLEAADYATLMRTFRWDVPERFNMGVAVCDAWTRREPERPAIIEWTATGLVNHTYEDLRRASNRLANLLVRNGIRPGDRVAILLPQSPETVIAHIAIYKIGAIALPLAALFGFDALAYRLIDSGTAAVLTDDAGVRKLDGIQPRPPELRLVLSLDGADGPVVGWPEAACRESDAFTPVSTGADDPALMIYTSGTTGQAKGALHGHRVLLGHVPGVQFPHEFLPQEGDRMWTPA